MHRRKFMALAAGAGAGFCTGCQSFQSTGTSSFRGGQSIDAGPVDSYSAGGVYDRFRDEGFFVISQDGNTIALSSVCPHRQCTVQAEADHTFYCPCHGSTFNSSGKVTRGPATSNLPALQTSTNEKGDLIVLVTT